MRDLAAEEIRRLHRKCARLDRRLAMVDLTGKVKPGSQDMEKRTLRLMLGKTAAGKDILSPAVRWGEAGNGRMKLHATPADKEQMTLHSSSGTVGVSSLARWGAYDKDNKPPSKSKDEAVLEFGGKSKITFTEGGLKVSVGDATVFEASDKELKMGVTFRAKGGSRPAHYKGGKDSDGDAAVDGNDDVLI